jgi:hypothetical protein
MLDLPVIVSIFRCFVSIDYMRNDCAFEDFMFEIWLKENEPKLLFIYKINGIQSLPNEGIVSYIKIATSHMFSGIWY